MAEEQRTAKERWRPPEGGPGNRRLLATAARGGATGLVGSVMGRLLNLAVQVLISRLYGPAVFGRFITGLITCQVLQISASLGLQKGGMRFLAIAVERGDPGAMKRILDLGTAAPLVGGAALGALCYALAPLAAARWFHDPALVPVLRGMALAVPFSALLLTMADFSRSFQTARYAVLMEELAVPVLLVVGFLGLRRLGLGERAAVYGFAGATALSAVVLALLVRRQWRRACLRTGGAPAEPAPPTLTRDVLAYSLPLMPMGLIIILYNYTDVVMLNLYADAAEVGQYAAAMRWTLLFGILTHPINVFFAPLIAGQLGTGRDAEVRTLYATGTRWLVFLTLPLFVFLMLARDPMLRLFGSEFTERGPQVLAVLLPGLLGTALSNAAGNLMMMGGRQWIELACLAGSLVLNVVLNAIMIPPYGAVGAAAATSISRLLADGARILVVWRLYGMQPFSRHVMAPMVAGVGLGVVGLAAGLAGWSLSPFVWLGAAAVGAGAVAAVILAAGLDPHDRDLVAMARRRLAGGGRGGGGRRP